ncbi:MAG: RNA polymerase sigma-70 factor [Ginsengibacter sp.]
MEKVLLLQVAKGDEIAFRQLYDVYRQKIFSLGMYLTHSEVLAEEIVQDVFMKVWEKRSQISEISFFNSWIRTVARNTCSNNLRSLAIEKLALHEYALKTNIAPISPAARFEAKEYQQILEEAIQQLPPQQRKVYLMSRRQGMKQEDIATKLNISYYTVKEYMKLANRSVINYLGAKLDIAISLAVLLYLKP